MRCATRDGFDEDMAQQGFSGRKLASRTNAAWNSDIYLRNLYVYDGAESTQAEILAIWVRESHAVSVGKELSLRSASVPLYSFTPESCCSERESRVANLSGGLGSTECPMG